MVLVSHLKLCATELDFLEKKFLPQKLGKIGKMGPRWVKNRVFSIYWKIWSLIFAIINLIYDVNLYCFLCSCTNPIFGKIFVPEIWAKMFSVNQISGFFNQPYLQKKSMKQPDFLHVDTNSHKLKAKQKVFEWAWSEMGLASMDCISRIN